MSVKREFEAIGTKWVIDIYSDIAKKEVEELWQKIDKRIAEFDANYSRFRNDSLVSQMAKKAGIYKLQDDAEVLFDTYYSLYKATGGAFTPLIGQTLVDAGYDAKYSLKPQKLTNPDNWEDALDYKFPNIEIKKPTLLDFGAGGKGYLVDIVSKIITDSGIEDFCVDAGGDMYYQNSKNKKLSVGLENPDNTSQAIAVAEILNQSIAGSAGNRRTWANFNHTINPHTLKSPENIKAIWVVAENTFIADSLTTCLYFTPPQTLLEIYKFEYVIMYNDNSVRYSSQFPATFFEPK